VIAVSAGFSIYEIVKTVFGYIGQLLSLWFEFEIFPGVTFGAFTISMFILSLVLGFLFSDFLSDLAEAINFTQKKEIDKEEYVGKHSAEGQAKHSRNYLTRNYKGKHEKYVPKHGKKIRK